MSKLSKETIQHLTQLCKIECTEEEKEAILIDLQNILNYFDEMNEIDTENVAPCNIVLYDHEITEEESESVMREDEIGELLPREDFLENAPSHIGGLVRVPPILKP